MQEVSNAMTAKLVYNLNMINSLFFTPVTFVDVFGTMQVLVELVVTENGSLNGIQIQSELNTAIIIIPFSF